MSVVPIAGTSLPWLLLELTGGTESQQGNRNGLAVVGSVMSVALIGANALALVPSDLTEGNEPATTTEGTEPQQGNRNGLALWLTVMVVAPIAGTPLPWLVV